MSQNQVLIVEDSASLRRIYAQYVEKEGVLVDTAATLADAHTAVDSKVIRSFFWICACCNLIWTRLWILYASWRHHHFSFQLTALQLYIGQEKSKLAEGSQWHYRE